MTSCVAQAVFSGALEGYALFTQESDNYFSDTALLMDLMLTNSSGVMTSMAVTPGGAIGKDAMGMGHMFHVHQGPVPANGNCSAVGPHFNPSG